MFSIHRRLGFCLGFCLGFALFVATWSAKGWADPELGHRVADVYAEDPDGAVVQLRRLKGQWVVLLYEDRDTTQVNRALKDALAVRTRKQKYGRRVRVVAVADTSGYDFWPAKGFAKSAIRKQAKALGLRIYCDWRGELRTAMGLRPGAAHVVVLDRQNKVRFHHTGALDKEAIKKVIAMIGPARGQTNSRVRKPKRASP